MHIGGSERGEAALHARRHDGSASDDTPRDTGVAPNRSTPVLSVTSHPTFCEKERRE